MKTRREDMGFRVLGEDLLGLDITERRKLGMGMFDNPFAYRNSWLHTIYVATTGNDATGNGTFGSPYLTLTKAMTVAVAGDGILLENGIYVENTGGTNFWQISKNLTDWLTIEPRLGSSGSVTITGNGSASGNTLINGTTSHIRFKWLTLGMHAASAQSAFRFNAACNNIDFRNCTFTPINGNFVTVYANSASWATNAITFTNCTINRPATGATNIGIFLGESATGDVTGFTLTNCTINSIGSGINLSRAGTITFNNCVITSTGQVAAFGSGGCDNVTFSNCALSGATGGYSFNGVANLVISGGSVVTSGAGPGMIFGLDAAAGGAATTAVVSNVTVTHPTNQAGHAVLFGNGCVNCSAINLTIPQAFDYALVLKEHTGTEVQNCTLVGGSGASVYFKAAVSPNVHDCTITVTAGFGLLLLQGDTGTNCANWQFQNNIVNVSGTGKALSIGNDTHDSGGGVCDYNTYQNNSGLGAVRNDANVANLTELQAAWADYDVITNDANSTVF